MHLKYALEEISSKKWELLSDKLYNKYKVRLEVDELSPQWGDKELIGFNKVSFRNFDEYLQKYGSRIRKYVIAIFDCSSIIKKQRIGNINVRHRDDSGRNKSDYPGISIYTEDGHKNIAADIVDDLGLLVDEAKIFRDMLNSLSFTIKISENEQQLCKILRNGDIESAISLVSRMIESKLRQMALANGVIDAANASGTDLASMCYNEKSGIFSPPYDIASNSNHGFCLILIGYMQYVRNGILHNVGIFTSNDILSINYLNLGIAIFEIIIKSKRR